MSSNRVSRRALFWGAAGAAAAPYVITTAALGNAQKPAASQRVGLGHIGVGGRGGSLFHEFQNCQGAQSVAVADCYQDRREAYAKLCKGRAYADFRQLLADPDVDAVIVATPDHWHVPIAIAAARAKKDAYVEKPLGVSIQECLACRKAFQEHDRVFQYGTQQRSMPHCHFGCELVRNWKIGKVQAIEVVAPNGGTGGSTQPAPVPKNLDYEMWCGPSPVRPYTPDRCRPVGTYWIYDYSIGYLGGWGAHPLDIMVWGCDADLAGPFSVEGSGKIPTEGLYDTVYDWDMKFQMAEGVKMTFVPGGDSTRFIGTEGWVRIWRGGIDAEPKSLLKTKISLNDMRLIDSHNHAQNFIDAVRNRRTPVSNLADAVRSDIISHLCNIAVRLGRKITWDPRAETVVGDDEAVRMMRREYRAPWGL
ncbi:MAG: Gfo/Idh/MocA family protein [Thermoguttaceae bacterium]